MGLTAGSVGRNACGESSVAKGEDDRVIALAGNPNVGKSTVFNALTGMKQHTGNWTGKTVCNAQGRCSHGDDSYIMVDIPGTYSLLAHSAEEEVARDFICFGTPETGIPDAVIVVCDASCLERNLNLVLQTIEITEHTLVCVNLLDEAEKKKISVDLEKLSKLLGVPVCGAAARSGKGINEMMDMLPEAIAAKRPEKPCVVYSDEVEAAVEILSSALEPKLDGKLSSRWTALKILEGNEKLLESINGFVGFDVTGDEDVYSAALRAGELLVEKGIDQTVLKDMLVTSVVRQAERYAAECMTFEKSDYYERDRRIDRVLTHKIWGVPIMAALLLVIFWITIEGANYPSDLLFGALFSLGDKLSELLVRAGAPVWLRELLIDGVYRVLAWVTSVMLPPMAIFFPLFTLLEDVGYLPRAAFNLDRHFKKAGACGKQALTMAMGFGCNAAGITGCRIIDSPRERLIAILTNSFVPCNGRFAQPFKGQLFKYKKILGKGVFSENFLFDKTVMLTDFQTFNDHVDDLRLLFWRQIGIFQSALDNVRVKFAHHIGKSFRVCSVVNVHRNVSDKIFSHCLSPLELISRKNICGEKLVLCRTFAKQQQLAVAEFFVNAN